MEVQGRLQRRNHGESPEGFSNIGESRGELSHQSGSRRSKERSREFAERFSISLKQHRHRSVAMDAMSHALCITARSLFSKKIERAQMPRRFNRLPFISYNGKGPLNT